MYFREDVDLRFIYEQSELQQIDIDHGTQRFLDQDQLNTSDPVRKPVDNVWNVWDSFLGSTYPKAGNFIWMTDWKKWTNEWMK